MTTTPSEHAGGPPRDPGWRPAVRSMGRVLLARNGIADSDAAAIIVARSVFVLHTATLAILLVLTPLISQGSDPTTAWVLVGVGVVLGGTGFLWMGLRPLEPGSARRLRGAYLTHFLVQMAFASSTALMGFVAALTGGSTIHYVASLVVATPMLARAAPTAGRIRAEDRAMGHSGRTASLADAVYRPGPEIPGPAGRED